MSNTKSFISVLFLTSLSGFGETSVFAASCPVKIGGLAALSASGAVGCGEARRHAMLVTEDDINVLGGILGCDVKVMIADTEVLSEKLELGLNKFEDPASEFTDQKQSFWV